MIAIILSAWCRICRAYVIVSKQKDAEIAQLKAAPPTPAVAEVAPKTVEKVVMVPAAAPVEESPQDILNDLLDVKLGSGSERNAGLRLVVFKLETLTHRGAAAVPAIRTFLARNVDVSYNQQDNQSDNQTNAVAENPGNGRNNNGTNNNRGFNRGGGGGGFGGFANFGGGGRNGGARRARNLENLRTDWVVPPSLRLDWLAFERNRRCRS
ncbi:MAG: hypothetical protein WDM76_08980 [Limisphaerales bacterium]